MNLPWETGDAIYSATGYLRWPAYVGILIWACIRFPLSKIQKVALCVIFAISHYWAIRVTFLVSSFSKGIVPGANMGVSFLFFLMMVAAGALVCKIPVLLATDALIPAYVLGRGLAVTGCIFAGCCHGYPIAFGLYSRYAETITFPTVPIDCIISCGIVIAMIVLARKKQWSGDGSTTAIGLLLFGVLRVVIDVLRDSPKLIFPFTFEGLCGFVYLLIGAILLIWLHNKHKKEIN